MSDGVWGYDWVADVQSMSNKFKVRETVSRFDSERMTEFVKFRMEFLREELHEGLSAETADDLVDSLIDLCVVAIGTLEATGVDAREAWRRVMRANMAKEPGVKESRPNPLGLPDLIKPPGWVAPRHDDNVGDLHKAFGGER